jgi:NADPH2 dehydrogenase
MTPTYTQIGRLKTMEEMRVYTAGLGIDLPFDDNLIPAPDGPLAQPRYLADGRKIANRFCIHPMEGWDGTPAGLPSELTIRRWQKFGRSGAKLIWGGEAAAVRPDGRANPNQLMILDSTMGALEDLRLALMAEHHAYYGKDDEPLVGLQLTHSGRFCRPNDKKRLEPVIVYHHPLLDAQFGLPADYPVITDAQIDDLIGDYVKAARRAQAIGFEFVDVKHCHSYLGHEFLSAVERPGPYGGSFENRTRFLREIVAGIRRDCPGLRIGVRLSLFDFPPFRPGEGRVGRMVEYRNTDGLYPYAFGGDPQCPGQILLDEPVRFLALLQTLGIELVNLSAASPYYNPHITRPAYFPPSDGYLPPEDPLVGVARQIHAAAQVKARFPDLLLVGSGYSYLQDWLPHVAQHNVAAGKIDFVGLGRMVLSYEEMPADVLAGREMQRKRVCRTFSDCTTAPRNGIVSGCYPLDECYKHAPEHEQLKAAKRPNKKEPAP